MNLNVSIRAHAGKAAKKGASKGGAGGGGSSEKKDKKGGLVLDGVFVTHTPSMDLKPEETQELTVYAFPTEVSFVRVPRSLIVACARQGPQA